MHFDLKPQNVLLEIKADQTFKCIICDFGYATVIGTERVNATGQLRGGVVKGLDRPENCGLTTQYAAPEVSQRKWLDAILSLDNIWMWFSLLA